MKKTLVALSTALLILIGSMFTPASVCAAQNAVPCEHVYDASYTGFCSKDGGTHPYGAQTCIMTDVYSGCYPRCTKCGHIAYGSPYWENYQYTTHSINHNK